MVYFIYYQCSEDHDGNWSGVLNNRSNITNKLTTVVVHWLWLEQSSIWSNWLDNVSWITAVNTGVYDHVDDVGVWIKKNYFVLDNSVSGKSVG